MTRSLFSALLAAAFAALLITASPARAEISHVANSAIQAHERGEFYLALKLYTEVIDAGVLADGDSLLLYALNNRAVLRCYMGDYQAGIEDLTRALNAKADPTVYVNRGDAWAALGNDDLAIADYDEAIRRYPRYAKAYFSRGFAWMNKGMRDMALKDFQKAHILDPTLIAPWE